MTGYKAVYHKANRFVIVKNILSYRNCSMLYIAFQGVERYSTEGKNTFGNFIYLLLSNIV